MTQILQDFEALVARTDRRPAAEAKRIAILGLFGELGSLVSEFKKRAREGDSYVSFGTNLIEEAGDILWYFTAMCRSLGRPLADLFSEALETSFRGDTATSLIDEASAKAASAGASQDYWIVAATCAGEVARAVETSGSDDALFLATGKFLRAVLLALSTSNIKVEQAISDNFAKTSARFPVERLHLPLYDERPRADGAKISLDEKLPKRLAVEFEEVQVRQKIYVVQKVFTLKIGDPLTDNVSEPDDYRFHDVFHFAYAAVLGWSPVIRALFKVKRKSFPDLDENEDGARAILVEEGIATWVFSRSKNHLFEGASGVDYSILRTIKEFVAGYEVEDQPFWAWEKAILQGYEAFRLLKKHRRGRVLVDLNERELKFEPLGGKS